MNLLAAQQITHCQLSTASEGLPNNPSMEIKGSNHLREQTDPPNNLPEQITYKQNRACVVQWINHYKYLPCSHHSFDFVVLRKTKLSLPAVMPEMVCLLV